MKNRILSILLPAALMLSTVAAEPTESRLPSQITMRDGRILQQVAQLRVYPDGILVSYEPAAGGLGFAKLKFRDLPEDIQKQYGYDEKVAAEYEAQQGKANVVLLSRGAEEDAIIRFRNLAEMNRSLAGDEALSYSVTLDSNGKVTARGHNRTTPAQTITNVSAPTPSYVPVWNGLFFDYKPAYTMPAPNTVVLTK